MRIAYVVGARPNFVKMAPVIAELRRRLPNGRHTLIHTGQHYDRLMSDIFLEELGVPAPDHMLGVGSASHAVQTARVMERIEPVLETERPDLVIVPGDVNSTLAATLVAVKLGIPVAHLESGLRSFDRTMPEEINRIVADEFSEYLFLHSDEAIENLRAEGIADERMHFVGNTMIDSLVAMEERFRNANAAAALGVAAGRLPARHAAPPGARRRTAAGRRHRPPGRGEPRAARPLPRAPAHAQDDGAHGPRAGAGGAAHPSRSPTWSSSPWRPTPEPC